MILQYLFMEWGRILCKYLKESSLGKSLNYTISDISLADHISAFLEWDRSWNKSTSMNGSLPAEAMGWGYISAPVPTHLLYLTLTSYSTSLSHGFLIMSSRDHKSIYPRGQLLRNVPKVLSTVLAHRIKTNDSLFNNIDTIYFLSTCQWILLFFFFFKEIGVSLTLQISFTGHKLRDWEICSTRSWPPSFCSPEHMVLCFYTLQFLVLRFISLSTSLLSSYQATPPSPWPLPKLQTWLPGSSLTYLSSRIHSTE